LETASTFVLPLPTLGKQELAQDLRTTKLEGEEEKEEEKLEA
jgi:hypothetical protein